MGKRVGLWLSALSLLCATPSFATFGIVGTTGAVVQTAQPADARVGKLESDTTISAWYESKGVLGSAVAVDATAAGTYTTFGGLTPGVVGAGTAVRSYMVHSDTVGSHHIEFKGSITFSGEILGVIVTNGNLVASDFLTTTKHSNHPARGYELTGASDKFRIEISGKTVTITRLDTSTIQDELRVITAVPEPGTIAIWSVVGLTAAGAYWRRRRSA